VTSEVSDWLSWAGLMYEFRAECPASKVVIGGGGWTDWPYPFSMRLGPTMTASRPDGTNAWLVEWQYRETGVAGFVTYAICADSS
jgi:hypothetical protein